MELIQLRISVVEPCGKNYFVYACELFDKIITFWIYKPCENGFVILHHIQSLVFEFF